MAYDARDTIAAIATAAGGGARGVVRLSGPGVLECLAKCFVPDDPVAWVGIGQPCRLAGVLHTGGDGESARLTVPCHLFLWPDSRSYTRESAAEIHAIGSPPVLAAALDELCRHGARPAEPGEFTLRAFLAGRVDLTQAEAVLGVVDARTRDDLDGALDQLAGGLSRPLHRIRDKLLGVLAELEAGLDFADEPHEFVGRAELLERIDEASRVVAETLDQLDGRDRGDDLSRVVLTGEPNVGKSSLFNALVERFGPRGEVRSLVSPTPGATRDFVATRLDLCGVGCELVDSAGANADAADSVERAAQRAAADQRLRADLRLMCVEAGNAATINAAAERAGSGDLVVATKCDLAPVGHSAAIPCSSVSGAGLDDVAEAIRLRIAERAGEGGVAASTAARCAGSLRDAQRALIAAAVLTRGGGDELLAAEIRTALHAIGEVVGAVCVDDVLDRVFSQFCIGK